MRFIKQFWHLYQKNQELLLLTISLALLIVALFQPTIQVEKKLQSHMIFIDVTQSMNVQDMQIAGQLVTRLDYVKYVLKNTLKAMPCDSKIGLGIFFKNSVATLYSPIDTCANYNVLIDTIDHLEWRMASQGNSNIRQGLQSIASTLITASEPSQVVFFTDGEEAAPLNIFSKTSLSGWQGGKDWLLVGVGGNHAKPIPKLDAKNNVVGYWSIYSIKIMPASNVSDGASGGRDESTASAPYEYYLSKLDEAYLKELAADINANYINAGLHQNLITPMRQQPLTHYFQADITIDWLFAGLALCLILYPFSADLIKKIHLLFKF